MARRALLIPCDIGPRATLIICGCLPLLAGCGSSGSGKVAATPDSNKPAPSAPVSRLEREPTQAATGAVKATNVVITPEIVIDSLKFCLEDSVEVQYGRKDKWVCHIPPGFGGNDKSLLRRVTKMGFSPVDSSFNRSTGGCFSVWFQDFKILGANRVQVEVDCGHGVGEIMTEGYGKLYFERHNGRWSLNRKDSSIIGGE